ncbi:molybdopterin-guanine dinucleotide biosynthesis protein A [Halopolyspora algeriensis]|uniref:Molybdopterin-guanine dinucleotide biosynthesis protein A n=1 Tax=Halopolyspora algeriensis TaxID=1500506 RepID=A0A368W1Y6_9ACTN|nr:molybdenum cofactor guanylyltransferase [Halopolyspora algeriensis]RCW45998.1 molybdopterin-guanine dinucleotide biosynthesis protein A [Halopolyspora algeriensis]TQM55411.1 molybdopterin-guanine dinucleotide biosynthesis protein A [Halopolyspora algeriensis]
MAEEFAAIILAGGRGSRLGGTDKAALRIEGRSLLERTLAAVESAEPVVVVGPPRVVSREVVWTHEDPPGGGPLAGLDAGLRAVPPAVEFVAVLAVDHPYLAPATLRRLVRAVVTESRGAGAVLTDTEGIPQWLLGVWRTGALRAGIPGQVGGGSVRSVLQPLEPVLVPGEGSEVSDVDTPRDLWRAGEQPLS